METDRRRDSAIILWGNVWTKGKPSRRGDRSGLKRFAVVRARSAGVDLHGRP